MNNHPSLFYYIFTSSIVISSAITTIGSLAEAPGTESKTSKITSDKILAKTEDGEKASTGGNTNESYKTIVVTGSRQQSELLTLTGNIDRISTEDITLVNAVHPSDILNRATAVHVHTNNGMESLPSLRSPVLTGPGAAGAFLFLEDGIATRSAGFANNNGLSELNIAQAQEVEIIRGPASAVYGSNAVHGVVNVLTKAPSDEGNLTLLAGPNQRYQLQGGFGKEYESEGYSTNFQIINDDGYRDNSGFTSLKLGLRHDYTDGDNQFKTTVSGFVLDQDTAGFISSGDNGDGCYSSSYADEDLYKDENTMEKNCNDDAYREWTSFRIASQWQRQLDKQSSFSMTPYVRINQMEFRQHYLPSRAIEENSHHSIGLVNNYNLQVNDTLSAVMGIDLEWTQGELTQTQQRSDMYGWGKARQQGVHYDYQVDTSIIAPYIQTDWQVNDQLKFTASVRFDATEYRYDNLIADGTSKADGSACVNNDNEPVSCLYQRPSDSDDSFDNTSTKLGFNYRIDNEIAFFGAWSQGFRAPQTTDMYRLQNQQGIGEIESEQLDSAEFGLRRVSDNLSYEVAIYKMKKKNFFFRDARGLNVTDGETSHQGIEISGKYNISDNIDIAINYSQGKHEYEFDRDSSGVVRGNEIDTAPEQLANIRLGWLPTDSSRLELEWLHMGDYYLDPANAHKYPGHNLLQLRSTMQISDDIALYARIENLTDERYASRADFAYGSYRFFGGQPRALHIGATIVY